MGNFQSTSTRTPDEEDGGSQAYPNLQNQYKSYGDSSQRSIEVLLSFSSIYKATKGILQKLCVIFNYLRPRKAADPPLPIQNPSPNAPREPLLHPPPQICSSSHSILEDSFGSLSGLSGAIDDEEARCENVGIVVSTKAEDPSLPIQNPSPHEPLLAPTPQICSRWDSSSHSLSIDTAGSLTGLITGIDDEDAQYENVGRCQMYSADRNEIDRDHVVSVPEIRCSNQIQVEISPCLEESVETKSSRKERKAREKVKRSIAVAKKEKRIKHYSSRHKILLVGEGDFSFSACLAPALGSAANIIATSLDSQGKPFSLDQRNLPKIYPHMG